MRRRLDITILATSVLMMSALVPATAASPTTAEPRPVWEHRTSQPAFTVLHDRAGRSVFYVANRQDGLLVFEASHPDPPQLLTTVPGSAFGGQLVNNLVQDGHYLYVAVGNFIGSPQQRPGLAIVDVSDPATPVVVDRWEHATGSRGAHVVEVHGSHAYLGGSHEGLIILDVSNPHDIRFVSQLVPDPRFPRPDPGAFQMPAARGLTVVNDGLLVLAYDAGGLRTIDIRDKANPVEIGRYINPHLDPAAQPQAYNNVVVDGTIAYVAVDYCGIEVVDIADPARPTLRSWWNPWRCERSALMWFVSAGHTNEIVLRDGRLFASAGATELVVVNVSDPDHPVLEASFGGRSLLRPRAAWGIDVTDTHVYLGNISSWGVPFLSLWSGVTVLRY